MIDQTYESFLIGTLSGEFRRFLFESRKYHILLLYYIELKIKIQYTCTSSVISQKTSRNILD